MPIHVDMTGVGESLKALPAGNYPARCDGAEIGVAKSSGANVLNLQYVITSGPHADRKLFQTISLKDTAKWKLYQTLKAFGYSEEELAGAMDLDEQELVNHEVTLVLVQRTWKGEIRHRISRVLAAGAGDVAPPLASEAPASVF